jgi:hypothetical protein
VAVHACNPSTWEAEADRSKVRGQLGLHSETLSQNRTHATGRIEGRKEGREGGKERKKKKEISFTFTSFRLLLGISVCSADGACTEPL